MRRVGCIFCSEIVAGFPSLRCEDFVPKVGRGFGPIGVVGIVGELVLVLDAAESHCGGNGEVC